MLTGEGPVRPRSLCGPCGEGFTYIGLLIFIAIMGVGFAAAGPVVYTLQLREKERELLFVGDQFRRAIALYYERTPGVKRYPRKLDELLRDNRFPGVERYLRKIYVDPMTGKSEWGLVEVPGVGIMGVYSLSQLPPVKTANFPAAYESFASAKTHSDWKFVYVPGQTASQLPTRPGEAQPRTRK